MNFLPRLFYEAANENGGGATTETEVTNETAVVENKGAEQDTPATEATKVEIPKSIITDEELKGYGFNSKEEFANFMAKQKENSKTPEQIKEEEDITKANFLKYSTENKLLNTDDYREYENLKSTPDKDLVYKTFKEEYKLEHPEITDEKELEEAAQEDFNYEYKLTSENEAARKKGEAKLAKEAKELRNPTEVKVTTAQQKFQETTKQEKLVRENLPKFEAFIDGLISKNAPDKLVAYKFKEGDSEIEVDIPLTKEDREAIAKAFKTPKVFNQFVTGEADAVSKAIDNKIQGYLFLNKKDAIISKGIELGKGLGMKKGSTVGAENSYAFKNSSQVQNATDETLEESNARIAKLRKQNSYS